MRIAVITFAILVLLIVLPIALGGWFSRHDGVSSSICTDCHKLEEIGISTTTGQPITQEFEWQSHLHQSLSDPDCLDCHIMQGNESQFFQHGLLNTSINNKCALCHIDSMPSDTLHLAAGTGCGSCHSPTAWSNVTFEHSQYFIFDSNHPSSCSNCHLVAGDFSQYSCYGGCHAHSEIVISSKHQEEGITNYQDCALCHQNGHED